MHTLVCQSYRLADVPAWLDACLGSVRAWAQVQGFDYRFVDDRLFDYAPDWYRIKTGGDVLPVSDLARLLLIREAFGQGYQRVVWADADILVPDPAAFTIGVNAGYAFCREVWVGLRHRRGALTCLDANVNNAVCVFVQPNSFLDFYIEACQSRIRSLSQVDRLDAGSRLLTALHDLVRLPLLANVALFSPLVLADVARGGGAALDAYLAHFAAPIHAANLCGSFRGKCHDGVTVDDALFAAAVERLLRTRGAAVNPSPARPPPG
jgi:hypothetical protein